MTEQKPEGWGFPMRSRKAHYFRDMFSLCRKWAYTGRLDIHDQPSKDDWAKCRKLRDKELHARRGDRWPLENA